MVALLTLFPLLSSQRFSPFFRVVVEPADQDSLLAYQQAFYERSGMQVSLDYLRNAHTTLFYWGTRQIGGYVLNTTEWNALRYLSFFSPTMRRNLLADKGLQEAELIELTCLWKARKLPAVFSAIFYASMLVDTYRVGHRLQKRFLMGGSVLGTIRHQQRQLLSTDIFIGFLPDSTLSTKPDQLVGLYTCPLQGMLLRATRLLLSQFVFRQNPLIRFGQKVARRILIADDAQLANRAA